MGVGVGSFFCLFLFGLRECAGVPEIEPLVLGRFRARVVLGGLAAVVAPVAGADKPAAILATPPGLLAARWVGSPTATGGAAAIAAAAEAAAAAIPAAFRGRPRLRFSGMATGGGADGSTA